MARPTRQLARCAGSVGHSGFRGNKAALPAKTCAVCGRTMVWRRAWARSWDEVKFCSERCRRARQRVTDAA
jgi:hypothetical protein